VRNKSEGGLFFRYVFLLIAQKKKSLGFDTQRDGTIVDCSHDVSRALVAT